MSTRLPRGGYDDGYEACDCLWGATPASMLLELARQLKSFVGLRVLDVGCGEGKNANFCAELGASVEAIDISAAALRNARRSYGDIPGVRWIRADARELDLPEAGYDLVVAYGVFHCLNSIREVEALVECLKRTTVPGGHHVVCAFNDRHHELAGAHPDLHPCLLPHGKYVRFYADWSIVSASDADLTESHPHNGIAHRHSLTRILAQKGSANG